VFGPKKRGAYAIPLAGERWKTIAAMNHDIPYSFFSYRGAICFPEPFAAILGRVW